MILKQQKMKVYCRGDALTYRIVNQVVRAKLLGSQKFNKINFIKIIHAATILTIFQHNISLTSMKKILENKKERSNRGKKIAVNTFLPATLHTHPPSKKDSFPKLPSIAFLLFLSLVLYLH